MNPSFLAIVNPAAGGGRCGELSGKALDRVRHSGVSLEVTHTQQPGEAIAVARDAYARGARNFLAVGGDGTAYEIINGLFPPAQSDGVVSLGFLPLGTGNSFLKDFTPHGIDDTIEALRLGRRRACDVIRLRHAGGEIHFINTLNLGFAADAGEVANRRFKRLGETGYVAGVLVRLIGLRHRVFPHRLDSAPWDRRPCLFLAFCNSKFTGGKMMIAPDADSADGRIEYVRWAPDWEGAAPMEFPPLVHGQPYSSSACFSCKGRASGIRSRCAGERDRRRRGDAPGMPFARRTSGRTEGDCVRNIWLTVRSAVLWGASGVHFAVVGPLLVGLGMFVDPRRNDWPQRIFFRNILRIAGVGFEVRRAARFDPHRTSVFICNHVNIFDPFVAYSAIPQFLRGFELQSHFKVPVYGWMMGRFGNIPVPDAPDRAGLEEMRRRAKAALDSGVSLIAFPEGSRTRDGHLRPFKKGIFSLAKKFAVPIVPVSIVGSYEFFRTGHWMLHPGRIVVYVHDPIDAAEVTDVDADTLRKRVQQIIAGPIEETSSL